MTNPLRVKKTSTPIEPPGTRAVAVWNKKTPATAMVRIPSSACMRPETRLVPGCEGYSEDDKFPLLDLKTTYPAYITFR
ncbi:hypothetical protein ARTHROSP310_02610 [Arthrobacter sp. AD-310]